MHIQMVETRRGSPDGHTVAQYHEGCIYEVADTMGAMFVRNGWASEIQGEVIPPTPVSDLGRLLEGIVTANDDFRRIFRPLPTRGSVPTNPATLSVLGMDGDGV